MQHSALRVAGTVLAVTLLPLAASAQSKAPLVAPQQRVLQQRLEIQAALQGDGKSDIDPFSRINASVTLEDDGKTLTIAGSGSGFDPSLSFVSFLYADPSKSRGALACLPPNPNPYTPQQMVTAYWLPLGSTHRTLVAQKTGTSYVSLASIGTMSVRYDSATPPNTLPTLDPAVNQTPGRFFLQSCGKI